MDECVSDGTKIVEIAMQALESDDPQKATDYFTEDFKWFGTFPHPLDKQRFFQMIMTIKKAFPDYTFNVKRCEEFQNGVCRATMEPLATHLGVLALPGLSPIQPTGISVALERHVMQFTLVAGKISKIKIEQPSGGGIRGLLQALGIEITEEMIDRMFK